MISNNLFVAVLVSILALGMLLTFLNSRGDSEKNSYITPHGCFVVVETSDGWDGRITDIYQCEE